MRLKRAFDLVLVVGFAPLWVPLALVVGLLVWICLGRPILFRQQRPGYRAHLFTLYKFRTMLEAFDHAGRPLADQERLTRFGTWLRRTSLDELPSLINVIRGEMSLVGPRPLLVDYLEHYTVEQRRRHDLLPGLTGWAQINGRNALSWPERFKLDLWYVDHQNFWLDCRILGATGWKVLAGEGIVPPDRATMPRFTGQGQSNN